MSIEDRVLFEIFSAIGILYLSPDGDTEFFQILTCVLHSRQATRDEQGLGFTLDRA